MTDLLPVEAEPAASTAPTRMTIPRLSLVFGYGPMLVLLALAITAWVAPPFFAGMAVAIGSLWASALLCFLAGVTRGLSFFTPEGPQRGQMLQMLWLFALGFASMMAPVWMAFVLLIMGYTSIAIFDPAAAKRGWAPGHFIRLRIPQMALAVVALLILLARVKLVP